MFLFIVGHLNMKKISQNIINQRNKFHRFYEHILLPWLYMPEKQFIDKGKIKDEWVGWCELRKKHLKNIN